MYNMDTHYEMIRAQVRLRHTFMPLVLEKVFDLRKDKQNALLYTM